jgi:diketogulonate reductase-like aldo/keto reductase
MDEAGLEALQLGIELGMTHIDTAEMYTGAEEVVAKAIQGRRDKVFLVSKVLPSNSSYKSTLRACDGSLKRLKTDYLDVYLVHWWSETNPIEETMRAMEELAAAGKTRHIGVSNFNIAQLKRAQKALTGQKIVCNQVLYHLRSRGIENGLIDYCQCEDIAVVGYSPFGQRDFANLGSRHLKVLESIGEKHNRTPRQVALNFLTRHHGVFSIPKSANARHVRENAGSIGWSLDDEDLKLIDRSFPLPGENEPLDMI